MSDERVLVTVADGEKIDDVVARLRDAGVTVEKVLSGAGVIVGTIAPGIRSTIESLSGVAGIEQDREVRLDPPDGPQ
ncbi:hypothetical protein [Pseudonocardia phyllosphaerae]|uniref:hypothetical protein n=1 Tax=Pseudonocardia phyllosphaerae TaxID=3390502 RepID=UPI00397AE7C2